MPTSNDDITLVGLDEKLIGSNIYIATGRFISFINNNGKIFYIPATEIVKAIQNILDNNEQIINTIINNEQYDGADPWDYSEKPYRGLKDQFFPVSEFPSINPQLESQSKGIFTAINAYVAFLLKEMPPETNKLGFTKDRLNNALNAARETPILLGPLNISRIALESLLYLHKYDPDKVIDKITITTDIAKIPSLRVYAWVSKSAIISGKYDSRVFQENPFIFNDSEYYLTNQWTENQSNGRSIEDLNVFLSDFSVRIVKKDRSFYLVRLDPLSTSNNRLPKPFLLLAGISGTGKTRFVRQQADKAASQFYLPAGLNYRIVPVRPDWHEPSDLLGYVSRISQDGHAHYMVPEFLHFIVAAWKYAAMDANQTEVILRETQYIAPFWLCLDEMNLAPVEQYLADYLSILETRQWADGHYTCAPLLKPDILLRQLDETGLNDFWKKLGLEEMDALSSGLRAYFLNNGIPIPPNLIVAGTVNMDETTHGFSRKVIDRALTIDFGTFFPNDYSRYYQADNNVINKPLSFPLHSEIRDEQKLSGVSADSDGRETQVFLSEVNTVLSGTPFELAYRALNEALLFLISFQPANAIELKSVWDDFIMMKLLPRIEGDSDKLGYSGNSSLLTGLMNVLERQLSEIWDREKQRPDLLRQTTDGTPLLIPCRSRQKLEWMQERLARDTFTSYWP